MMQPSDVMRVNNDVNGNPRYVVHFLHFLTDKEKGGIPAVGAFGYGLAVKRANAWVGGKRYRAKSYGGGIVFSSYSVESECRHVNEELEKLNREGC